MLADAVEDFALAVREFSSSHAFSIRGNTVSPRSVQSDTSPNGQVKDRTHAEVYHVRCLWGNCRGVGGVSAVRERFKGPTGVEIRWPWMDTLLLDKTASHPFFVPIVLEALSSPNRSSRAVRRAKSWRRG